MSKTPDKSAPLTGAIPYNNLNNPQTVEENPYSDDITVVVNNKPVAITRGSHHHDSYEFVITYSEIPYMIIDNKIYNVPKNSLFAVNPMQEHGLGKDLNNFRLCGIHISKEFMQNVAANIYNRSDIFFSNDPFIVGHDLNMLIRLFLEEMKYLRIGRELMINNLGTMLAVTFIRNINSNLTSIPHNPPRLRKDSIRKIIDYMNENYSRNISVQILRGCYIANFAVLGHILRYHPV
jgi:AraC family transcriptional regulator